MINGKDFVCNHGDFSHAITYFPITLSVVFCDYYDEHDKLQHSLTIYDIS